MLKHLRISKYLEKRKDSVFQGYSDIEEEKFNEGSKQENNTPPEF